MKLNCEKLRAVLFDWDGTLAESNPPKISAVNQEINTDCRIGKRLKICVIIICLLWITFLKFSEKMLGKLMWNIVKFIFKL